MVARCTAADNYFIGSVHAPLGIKINSRVRYNPWKHQMAKKRSFIGKAQAQISRAASAAAKAAATAAADAVMKAYAKSFGKGSTSRKKKRAKRAKTSSKKKRG